ncbi:MAG: tyrosine-type recombinase/integrase [Acidobacteriia bacterium]|nr:tyrosine-type recombinase/integrase [Terriglobia bacterium]
MAKTGAVGIERAGGGGPPPPGAYRYRRRLPTVLSREEVSCLINAAGTLFRRTLLMTLYGTGMRRSELARLKVSDIDS